MFLGGASGHCHTAPRQGQAPWGGSFPHTQFVWDHLVLKAEFAGINTGGSMPVWLSHVSIWREEHIYFTAVDTAPVCYSRVRCPRVVWTVAASPLPIGTWLTESQLPLYDFFFFKLFCNYPHYILSSMHFQWSGWILYVLCILMRGCALPKKWTSVLFYHAEGIPAHVWPWWKFIMHWKMV